jgi:peptidoglycan/LPS O-acetylase OafA/YrhL
VEASSKFGHVPALDGLRGLCIIAVIGFHAGVPLFQAGYLGVDGFFVLSGYLITSILLKERDRMGRISLRAFYTRRALRLLPALTVFLAACLAYTMYYTDGARRVVGMESIRYTALYLGNWLDMTQGDSAQMGMLTHTWSLAVEEHFYLVWPLVLILLLTRLRSHRRIMFAMLGLFAFSVLWPAAVLLLGASATRMGAGSDTRAHALLCGAFLALLLAGGYLPKTARTSRLARIALVALALPAALIWLTAPGMGEAFPTYYWFGDLPIFGVFVAMIILHTHLNPSGLAARALSFKPLAFVGVISYSLYLWHSPIVGSYAPPGVISIAVRVGVSLLLAVLSYRYIERPFLRLKNKLPTPAPRTASPLLAGAQSPTNVA